MFIEFEEIMKNNLVLDVSLAFTETWSTQYLFPFDVTLFVLYNRKISCDSHSKTLVNVFLIVFTSFTKKTLSSHKIIRE